MSFFALLLNPLSSLLLVGLALWYLRRHRDDPPGEGAPRWLRGLAIGMLVLFVGSFGVCGAWGTVVGVVSLVGGSGEERSYAPIFVVLGGLGLAIAIGLGWLFRRLTRPGVAAAPAPSPYELPPTDRT